jgi:hypothetical protein
MTATIITHFYNEEKLLRWWLPHHRAFFGHGILIDHGSTDRSVELCRALAPDWTVVRSRLSQFDAVETDREVMEYESTVKGWKMALNTSEFFVAQDFAKKLASAEANGIMTIRTTGVFMVDNRPDSEPDEGIALVSQKFHGFVENGWRAWYPTFQSFGGSAREFWRRRGWRQRWRHRILHRHPHGDYLAGRHLSRHPTDDHRNDMFTLWYCYSPWRPWFIGRKIAIGPRIPEADRAKGLGAGHHRTESQLDRDYRTFRRFSYDLRRVRKLYAGTRDAAIR